MRQYLTMFRQKVDEIDKLEDEVNEFLKDMDSDDCEFELIRTTQSQSNGYLTVSLWYRHEIIRHND